MRKITTPVRKTKVVTSPVEPEAKSVSQVIGETVDSAVGTTTNAVVTTFTTAKNFITGVIQFGKEVNESRKAHKVVRLAQKN